MTPPGPFEHAAQTGAASVSALQGLVHEIAGDAHLTENEDRQENETRGHGGVFGVSEHGLCPFSVDEKPGRLEAPAPYLHSLAART